MIVATVGSLPAASVLGVHVGRARPLGPEGVPSGFVKTAVAGAVRVRTLGLEGDEQADLRVHGGVEKAVYGYAVSNYPRWRADFPARAALFAAGGMGENLAIDGLDESGVCIGDVHEIGTAQLIVSQPRIYPMTIDKDGVLMTRNFSKEKFEMIDQIIENQGDILANQIPKALTTVIRQTTPEPKVTQQAPPVKQGDPQPKATPEASPIKP